MQLARPKDISFHSRISGEVVRLAAGQLPCRVLVVDDQTDNRLLLKCQQEKTGFQVFNGLIRQVQQLSTGAMASLTGDRGSELAQHKRFTVATDVAMYFCDPRSPWQRGTNENTNCLLRNIFLKIT